MLILHLVVQYYITQNIIFRKQRAKLFHTPNASILPFFIFFVGKSFTTKSYWKIPIILCVIKQNENDFRRLLWWNGFDDNPHDIVIRSCGNLFKKYHKRETVDNVASIFALRCYVYIELTHHIAHIDGNDGCIDKEMGKINIFVENSKKKKSKER